MRKPGEVRPDEETDDKSQPPKDDRFHKSQKKKTQVLDEVEACIPSMLAPVRAIIAAKGVGKTEEWDRMKVGKSSELTKLIHK